MKILFENELGVADFHLPNKSCILYVSECDIIAGNGYKRKLVRYRNVSLMNFLLKRWRVVMYLIWTTVPPDLKASSSFQQLVLVENTRLSEQYFSAVQKFVVFDLGLTLLPVSGQTEASQLITQMVKQYFTPAINMTLICWWCQREIQLISLHFKAVVWHKTMNRSHACVCSIVVVSMVTK